jgi:hypothetical protein
VFYHFKKSIPYLLLIAAFFPCPAFADFVGQVEALKSVILGRLFPLAACIGLAFSAYSLLTGNPNARQHVTMAIAGCVVGFGAEGLIELIRGTVR